MSDGQTEVGERQRTDEIEYYKQAVSDLAFTAETVVEGFLGVLDVLQNTFGRNEKSLEVLRCDLIEIRKNKIEKYKPKGK